MPHKNTVRYFAEGHLYHIYNRGVEKRTIFHNHQDYNTFLSILDYYLNPQGREQLNIPIPPSWRSSLIENEVEVCCYCLMPNHFHFLLKQNTHNGITRFMRRLSSAYVQYFNKAYNRKGTLFEGKYKAVRIETDEHLFHLSRYIHRNPKNLVNKHLEEYLYSSYQEYKGIRSTEWLKTEAILNYYKTPENQLTNKHQNYPEFVEFYELESDDIKHLILDSD
jgi:putative transposase